MNAIDNTDAEPDALLAQVLRTGLPLYGLAAPGASDRWVAKISAYGVALACLVGGEFEVEVGSTRRSAVSDSVGRDRMTNSMRLGLARDLTLRARYPAGGAVGQSHEWWANLVEEAGVEAAAIAEDPDRWQTIGLFVDGVEYPAWSVDVDEHWGVYCEHEPGYISLEGVGKKPIELKVKSVSAAELAKYDPAPEDLDEAP